MCGKGLTAGDGKGGVPCACAVQRYGPLGLGFMHTCHRTLHNDVGVLGTRGLHIGVRRIVQYRSCVMGLPGRSINELVFCVCVSLFLLLYLCSLEKIKWL